MVGNPRDLSFEVEPRGWAPPPTPPSPRTLEILETLLVVTAGGGRATGSYLVEARDAANAPTGQTPQRRVLQSRLSSLLSLSPGLASRCCLQSGEQVYPRNPFFF